MKSNRWSLPLRHFLAPLKSRWKTARSAWSARGAAGGCFALVLLGGAAVAADEGAVSAEPQAARLVLNSPKLEPASTFEIRFAEPMVGSDSVGKVAEPPPIEIIPKIEGQFVWLSTRSGVFSPSEALPLSTTFHFALRQGVKNAGGGVLRGTFEASIETPPFGLKGWAATQYFHPRDIPAQLKLSLLFNANVQAAEAESFITFVNKAGVKIPALVTGGNAAEHAGESFPAYRSDDRSVLTWAGRFHERKTAAKAGGYVAEKARENLLHVRPAQPLTVGEGWKVVLAEGLPAGEAGLRLLANVEFELGTVTPFEVKNVEARNDGTGGRRLLVTFTKPLATALKAENIARWIKIQPAPAKLTAKVGGVIVEFSGNFALDTDYHVEVVKGIAAAQPFTLGETHTTAVSFEPIPSSLALEGFATHQLNTGSRHFHLRVINTPKLRVSAKLLPPETLSHALATYDERYLGTDVQNVRGPLKVAPDKFAGKTIFSREIAGTKEVDTEREIKLSWDEVLGAGKTGAVLLTVEQEGKTKGRPGAQAVIQVTDLGVVWKSSPSETFAHVFSLATGAPVAGAKLRLIGAGSVPLGQTVTTDGAGGATLGAAQKAKWLLAESGTDAHLVALDDGNDRLSLYRFRVPHHEFDDELDGGEADGRQVFLFTERGVYKPGETVHLKGFVRDTRKGLPHLPAGLQARIKAVDDRGREIFTRTAALSEYGSLDTEIPLPKGTLGTYVATVAFGPEGKADEAVATYDFQVQEYTPNAFEIMIGGPKQLVGIAPLEVPITAKYYMGKALSQAQMSWSLEAEDQKFAPEGFDGFDFCDAIDDYRVNRLLDRASHFADQGKLQLSPAGDATVATTILLNTKAPQPRHARLLCEITDLNQQTVSQTGELQVDSSDFYLGLAKLPEVVQKGDRLPIGLVAVRTDGTPNPAPVSAKLRVTRIDWQNNRVVTDDDASENETEPLLKLVEERVVPTQKVEEREHRWMLAGEAEAKLVAGEPGLYLLEASAQDAGGREVLTSTTFYVTGENVTEWNYRNEYQIELVSDKLEYLSGETARILVKTPIAGDALITVERDHVLRSFVAKPTGNAPSVEVPLQSEDAPNVFVSVMLLRGANDSPRKFKEPDYRIGFCQLKVMRPESKLSVYVAAERPKYQPGEAVTVTAEVRDFRGKPRSNAEVTLYAVDEGVLSLTGYTTPDPLKFFNTPVPLSVTTSLTLPSLLREDPEQKSYENKGYMIGGGGDLGEAFRKNFVTCAFWNANLRTDEEGRVTANFTAPDSLTRYRLIAVVQTKDDAFGAAESAFEISKPVMLDPALPRFANVGDKLSIRGILHNLTATDGEVEVQLALDETASTEHPTRQVTLPAHGSLAVDFPVEFKQAGVAKWKWTARFTGADGQTAYRDAVQSTLNVGYPVAMMREVQLARTDEGKSDLLANANPTLMEGEGVVRVNLGNSRIIEMRESLEQLLHYPYGCVEQTTSSTLPWIVMRDFRASLPELSKTDAQITNAVNHGIDRLLTMQTGGGGLSYWPGGRDPHFWGSAYGGLGMAIAKRAGYAVPAEAFDSLCKYLSTALRGAAETNDRYLLSERCLAVYTLALAQRAEPAYHELLFKKRDALTDESRALLALAIQESKGRKEMIADLLEPHRVLATDEDAFWCGARESAVRLLAWTQCEPEAPAVEALATELFGSRAGGHWVTTQGNAWALLALNGYFKNVEKPQARVAGTLAFGRRQDAFALDREKPVYRVDLPFGVAAPHDTLLLQNPEQGRIFSEVVIESRPHTLQQPRQAQGYSIERTYSKIEDDGSVSELKDATVGDRVLVTLQITVSRRARYVAVDDPLPAILEAVNPVFKSQETRAGQVLGQAWAGDFQELREDRALFFADYLSPGDYSIRYLARVRAAGTATAPAAKIEEMYHPERFGTTATMQLTSLQLK